MQTDNGRGLDEFLARAEAFQQQLADVEQALRETTVTGSAGNGLVTMHMGMEGQLIDLRIDPEIVDPNDVATLEALVREAFHDVTAALRQASQERLRPVTEYMGELGGLFR
ncbi:YbaB/EbfC family nucleoid-associated protein [Dactylosporangium sp. CA-233914]|uniref:YbaB/EbfC family nucleoid-associated protein n=1 Tax=Dactylosporangium sp. CA-233914 TaxID=3239934 RepID=UPI003D8D6E0D